MTDATAPALIVDNNEYALVPRSVGSARVALIDIEKKPVTLISDLSPPSCVHPKNACNRLACPLAPSPSFPPFFNKSSPYSSSNGGPPGALSSSGVTSFAVPSLAIVLQQFPAILCSAAPYVLFLLLFAVNPYIHVLLTADDVTSGAARLNNVSAWESHVMPFSVHRLVSGSHCTALDLVSTVPYMLHYVIPVLFPLYLAFTDRLRSVPRFYKLLGLAMWFHYALWYLLPTAPPWAYSHGVDPLSSLLPPFDPAAASSLPSTDPLASSSAAEALSTPPHPKIDLSHREGAAFARVDALTGYRFFYNMFHGNPVPFAAFPSGHVTWPTCMFLIGSPGGERSRLAGYALLVAWATLYSSHHYLFDALAAVMVTCVAYAVLCCLEGDERALGGSWSNRLRLILIRLRRSSTEQNQGRASNGDEFYNDDDKLLLQV